MGEGRLKKGGELKIIVKLISLSAVSFINIIFIAPNPGPPQVGEGELSQTLLFHAPHPKKLKT